MIEINKKSILAAQKIQTETPEYQGKSLRVYLAGKGCDGFTYGVCFDDYGEGDTKQEVGGLTILIDKDTLPYVEGSTIEWVDDTRGKGFEILNPNHKKYRGKFFKRKSWQEKLTQKN